MNHIIAGNVAPIKSIALKNLPAEGLGASHILERKTLSVAVLSQYLEAITKRTDSSYESWTGLSNARGGND